MRYYQIVDVKSDQTILKEIDGPEGATFQTEFDLKDADPDKFLIQSGDEEPFTLTESEDEPEDDTVYYEGSEFTIE